MGYCHQYLISPLPSMLRSCWPLGHPIFLLRVQDRITGPLKTIMCLEALGPSKAEHLPWGTGLV